MLRFSELCHSWMLWRTSRLFRPRLCPRGFFHSPPMRFIPLPPSDSLTFSVSLYIYLYPLRHYRPPSRSLPPLYASSYEIKHESIIHSFKCIYHQRRAAWPLSCEAFFSLRLSYSPLVRSRLKTPRRRGVGWGGGAMECILAMRALTRVVP